MPFIRWLLCAVCLGFVSSSHSVDLPTSVLTALQHAKIPLNSVAVVVQAVHQPALISVNAQEPMNPASTIKLLTTFAGLELLGPAHRWKTEVYLDGTLDHGILHGNLLFKGYGNPKLTVEEFWLWLRELRARGLREVTGDVVLDQSFFSAMPDDPAEFDNDPSRPYNVTPKALLLNFNALRLKLMPQAGAVNVWLEPELGGYGVVNKIRSVNGLACTHLSDYAPRLENGNLVLEGKIPADCGETERYFALLPHNEYFFAVFRSLWRDLGGSFKGKLRLGNAAADQSPFATHWSLPLADVVRDINKFSNNTMARQLFLSLSTDTPATLESSAMAVQTWLATRKLNFPELVLENGAGLSRKERISAQHLATLLSVATTSPFAAELESSLPIPGLDGTLKKRFKDRDAPARTHLKTGSLKGVKSMAGYVGDKNGKLWIMVFIVNHPRAAFARSAQDELVSWIERGMQ